MSSMPFQKLEGGSRPGGRHRIGQAGRAATGSQLCGRLTSGVQHSPAFFQRQLPQSPELHFVGILLSLRNLVNGGQVTGHDTNLHRGLSLPWGIGLRRDRATIAAVCLEYTQDASQRHQVRRGSPPTLQKPRRTVGVSPSVQRPRRTVGVSPSVHFPCGHFSRRLLISPKVILRVPRVDVRAFGKPAGLRRPFAFRFAATGLHEGILRPGVRRRKIPSGGSEP